MQVENVIHLNNKLFCINCGALQSTVTWGLNQVSIKTGELIVITWGKHFQPHHSDKKEWVARNTSYGGLFACLFVHFPEDFGAGLKADIGPGNSFANRDIFQRVSKKQGRGEELWRKGEKRYD